MQKSDLKVLVEQIYENLLERIESEENTSKQQVIGYLKDAIDIVANINDKDLDTIEHTKESFKNSYKEIVKESLDSYQNTNEKFGELTQLNKETILKCNENHIDLNVLSEKFNEIHTHMSEEVKKANKVISNLHQKVKILEETSNLDPLTKVFNRRALGSYLNEVCENTNRPYMLHIMMLDIDNFKSINDKYGHVAGDKILIFISNILRKTLRDGDKIFRYGGEEFTIIINRNSDEQCELIANRLLTLISSNNLIYMGERISVTASIGVTKLKESDTPDSILARADKALYNSKKSGKNMFSKDFN
ncbi:MAG TPA: GGDEF domain-containing protein [Sulfurimonas sp.]|uniref:GGDEF domain-containing protein n=1 Tax=Sulfurimonas sp. TaxID=2022749 RepID=UPI002C4F9308|nr:GGDEF domain-containing protein [Sulfurimonas sp.]HUH42605.1 GGDEF domain-containing protein [Sulfurimonas sp.]